MSDSDDGFDEEAVREELQEKYEDEREDREATARMSELLLQGATMTNDHCDRCGSPLFRYEGQTFCPNCQHAAQQAQAEQEGQSQGQQEQAQRADTPAVEGQQPRDSQTRAADADGGSQPDEVQAGGATDGQQRPPATGRSPDRRTPPSQQAGEETGTQRGRDTTTTETPARNDPSRRDLPEHAPTAEATGPAGDALESTIAALARRAASADDPRTAREYLEAAREAAEALAALR